MSARDQLDRLLYVLARAAQPQGARVDELARALEVAPAQILADIEEATARVFYHPAGTVDAFDLSVEGDVVRLYGGEFNRPVRLSAREAMALGLGLRVLAAEAEPQRRGEILELANLLEQELVTPEITLQPAMLERALVREPEPLEPAAAVELEFGADDFRGDLAEAIDRRVYCEIVYLKADGSAPARRRIAPVRLMYTRGHWYVRAFEQDALRNYRLDRILELSITEHEHAFEDVPAEHVGFSTEGGERVAVRYSPAVARWVAEAENLQCAADGTLVVEYDVVDMNWLVRHILHFGGDAEALTEGAREAVRRRAQRVLRDD